MEENEGGGVLWQASGPGSRRKSIFLQGTSTGNGPSKGQDREGRRRRRRRMKEEKKKKEQYKGKSESVR